MKTITYGNGIKLRPTPMEALLERIKNEGEEMKTNLYRVQFLRGGAIKKIAYVLATSADSAEEKVLELFQDVYGNTVITCAELWPYDMVVV